MTRSKFGVRTDAKGKEDRTVDGILFASKREKKRYCELRLMEKCCLIYELELQPQFELSVDGVLICKYRADFQYKKHENGSEEVVVEDSKGFKTPEYKLKRKLMKAIHGIEISEV